MQRITKLNSGDGWVLGGDATHVSLVKMCFEYIKTKQKQNKNKTKQKQNKNKTKTNKKKNEKQVNKLNNIHLSLVKKCSRRHNNKL